MSSERERSDESSMLGYELAFDRAAEAIGQAVDQSEVYMTDSQKLQLFALYKQASEGDCELPLPSVYHPVDRAKWNAWRHLHGMNTIIAKRRYVVNVLELLPSFQLSPVRQQERSSSSPATDDQSLESPLRKEPFPSSSYLYTLCQVGSTVALVFGAFYGWLLIWPSLSIEIPRNVKDATVMPIVWFGLGGLIMLTLKANVLHWKLLDGELMWLPHVRKRYPRRQRRRGQRAPKVPTFEELGLTLVKEGEASANGALDMSNPRLELSPPAGDPNSTTIELESGHIPFPVEQTGDMHFRKFKEPLPDPANPLLEKISTIMEHTFEEYAAIYRQRLLCLKNDLPYLIKRFINTDYMEYVEHSLFDKRNRVLYVYVVNKSFSDLGTVMEYIVYRPSKEDENATEINQSARMVIKSASINWFRSQIEPLTQTFYTKDAMAARAYLVERLEEEFGQLQPAT